MSHYEAPLPEPLVSVTYKEIDHSTPMRMLLGDFAEELRHRSEEPLSPPEQGMMKREVGDKLFNRSMAEKVATVDPVTGLSFSGLHAFMQESQTAPTDSVALIEHELYKHQEHGDEAAAELMQALRAADYSEIVTFNQIFAGSRVARTEATYDEFLALETGQTETIRRRILKWQHSGKELEGFQEDTAHEIERLRRLGHISIVTVGKDFTLQMARRFLQADNSFRTRAHQSPLDYVKETYVESAKETFLNAATVYSSVVMQEQGYPLPAFQILHDLAASEGYTLPPDFEL